MNLLHNALLIFLAGFMLPSATQAEPKQEVTVVCPDLDALVSEIDTFARNATEQQSIIITSPSASTRVAVSALGGFLCIEVPIESGSAKNPPKGRSQPTYTLQKPKGDFKEKWNISPDSLADVRKFGEASGLKMDEDYYCSKIEVVKDEHAETVTVYYLHMIKLRAGKQGTLVAPLVKKLLETVLKVPAPYEVGYSKIFPWSRQGNK